MNSAPISTLNTDQLTFTRFVAAISIVIYHFGDIYPPFNYPYIASLIHSANIGVSYFFVLSGVVMVFAYQKFNNIGVLSYLKKRGARILPLYYFAMLCMLAYYFIRIKVLNQSSNYSPSLQDVFLHSTLLQSWFPQKATTINTAAWSLSVEMFFYLLFPLLFKWFKNKTTLSTFAFTFSIYLLSQVIFHYALDTTYATTAFYHPLLHLNSFIIGLFVGFVTIKNSKTLARNNLIPLIGTMFIITGLMIFPIPNISFHNGAMSPLFGLFIYYLSTDKSFLTSLFKKPIMINLGEISYGIYILQFPVFFFFTATLTFFGYKIDTILFYVFLLILVIVSALSYHWIEKPLRARIRRLGTSLKN